MSAQGHEGPYSVRWGICRAWPPTPTHHGQQRLGAAQDYGGCACWRPARLPASIPAAPGPATKGLTLVNVPPFLPVPSLFQAWGEGGLVWTGMTDPSHPSVFVGCVEVSRGWHCCPGNKL